MSLKGLPAVLQRAWRAFPGKGKSKWIFKNNNMLIKKREKKPLRREGGFTFGLRWRKKGYLFF